MKFGPGDLRFTYPVWASFRGQLVFIGRRNTIHLQETALVIEGDLLRFRLPIIDRFVRRVFCEWTMVTVPYSRVVRQKHCAYRTVKVLWWLFAALLGGSLTILLALQAHKEYLALALLLPALALVGVLVHLLFRQRHVLVFRGADGKRRLVCFRITSRPRRKKFLSLLKANLDAVRALPAPAARAKVSNAP
ncbi:MAG TPA: hypothetical protein VFE78_30970 [Gemmataceae bacterium]|jgi:hypothetical protein|nr:hypothetical protein [Gemmataceae bacterium]